MTTRGEINSNFYQIVNVDSNGNPTDVKPEYLPNVGNANYAANAGHANVADTANSVAVANVVGIGNIATLNLDGSASNVLYGNGVFAPGGGGGNSANANYANFAGTAFNVSGSNVTGYVGDATHATIANIANTVSGANVTGQVANANYALFANYAAFANVANKANTVAGANVTGQVANANYSLFSNVANKANSVAVANVTGIGNIATINLTGSTSNVLYGNGTFAPIPTISNVANSNYANFAGTAFNVSGSNVTGSVNLANFATVANSVAGSNVSGQVSFAAVANSVAGSNVSGAVNLANFATTANSVAGANVSGQVANALVAGTVTSSAQPNITSLGNITGLISTGNITAPYFLGNVVGNISGNIVVPGLQWNVLYNDFGNAGASNNFLFDANTNVATITGNINANYFIGNGSQLTDITAVTANYANFAGEAFNVSGSNVTGQVSNALVAGTVYSSAQPNITSVGSLLNLDVLGNIDVGNVLHATGNIEGAYYFGNGAYLTGIGNLSAARGYWGSFYSNVTQTATSNTASYAITLNNTDPNSYGVYISSGSRINFIYAGTYNLQLGVQVINTSPNPVESDIWLRKNGVDVVDSRGSFVVLDKQSSLPGQGIVSWNYIVQVNAGDYFELYWHTEDYVHVSLEYLPPGTTPTTPASPSIIVTAMQVTNVQPANLSGSLTGDILGNGHSITQVTTLQGNLVEGNYFIGNGSNISSINGSNVTGTVANANYSVYSGTAFSVSGSNVSGAVNLANFASVANSVAGANVSGTVANASYSVIAGTAYNVSAGNISGTVNLANFATVANSVAGSNVSGAVGLATFATTANAVAGANVSGAVNLATYATTANAVAGANVSGAVNLATYATTANAVAGANVSGTVANATFATTAGSATTAGTVTTNAQPNITSLGTLTSLNVSGVSNLNTVSNVIITGGTSGYVLSTNGSGNLSWVAQSGGSGSTGFENTFLLMGA